MNTAVTIVIAAIVGIALYFRREKQHAERVKVRSSGRTGADRNTFIQSLLRDDISQSVADTVYDYFSALTAPSAVNPEDNLASFYEFTGDRYEEALDVCLTALNLSPDSLRTAEKDYHGEVSTVQDFATLLEAARKSRYRT